MIGTLKTHRLCRFCFEIAITICSDPFSNRTKAEASKSWLVGKIYGGIARSING